MEKSSSMFGALVDMIVDPKKAWVAADDHPRWFWLPLIITIIAVLAMWAWYFQIVDFEWLKSQMIAANPDMSGEERDALEQYYSPTMAMVSTMVSIPIVMLIIHLLYGLYLHLVAKSGGEDRRGFGHWFGFSAWSGTPGIVAALAGLGWMLAKGGDGQITQNQLNFTSLNAVLFQYPDSHAWATLLGSVTIFTFWSLGLAALGWKIWRGSTWGKSLAVVAAPYIVIYGLWIAWIAFK